MTDPAVRARAQATLARIAALPEVASFASPYAAGGTAQIAPSAQVAFANVTLTKQAGKFSASQARQLVDTARAGAGEGLQVQVEGQVAEATNRNSVSTAGLGASAALIVLLVVFGSLLAATLPLITAGVALGAGTATIGLLSHLISMASFTAQLSLLIGLGVGFDYALFIVTRYRQGLQRGKNVPDEIVDVLEISGRAVMFAGIHGPSWLCRRRHNHDLRHSFASLLLHEGRSVIYVARQLGIGAGAHAHRWPRHRGLERHRASALMMRFRRLVVARCSDKARTPGQAVNPPAGNPGKSLWAVLGSNQ